MFLGVKGGVSGGASMRERWCESVFQRVGDGLRGRWRWSLCASEMVSHTKEMLSHAEAQRAQSFSQSILSMLPPYGGLG